MPKPARRSPRQLDFDSKEKQSHPSLRKCITLIKSLAHRRSDLDAKEKAELYLSSVSYLSHLKKDQSRLFETWKRKRAEQDYPVCPSPGCTPAITALLEDSGLFQTFLSMLRPNAPSDTDSTTSQMTGAALRNKATSQLRGNRKRSASVSMIDHGNESSSKATKLLQSPAVLSERSKTASAVSLSLEKKKQLDFDASVFAATVFYTALQHFDHWPAALLKAYAEDSFGPRRWVDDERCNLLTKNLALAIRGEQDRPDEKTLSSAERYAGIFTNLARARRAGETEEASSSKKSATNSDNASLGQRSLSYGAGSNKDDSSSDSDSGEEECIVEVSTGIARKPSMNQAPKADESDSSSSGDEEEIEEEVMVADAGAGLPKARTPSSKPSSDAAGRSATETDTRNVDGVPESSSLTSSIPASPLPSRSEVSSDAPYPWYQKSLDMTQVRHRFVGKNLHLVHQDISDALSSRLDAKVKQNSGLLSTLPSFMSVPGVRRLAARQLERWLQSPALAGLARAVFSSVVSEIRNVDPPLEDDMKAIDSILSMKLKANQLTAHIGNVTRIAQNIPTLSVSHHMFLHLLRSELAALEGSSDTQTKVLHADFFIAVHSTLPSEVAANALALALLDLLEHSANKERVGVLLRQIALSLGTSYDGRLLVKAMLESSEADGRIKSASDAEDIARLTYECVTLMAPLPEDTGGYSRQHSRTKKHFKPPGIDSKEGALTDARVGENFSNDLLCIRKSVLRWCVSTYANSPGAVPGKNVSRTGSSSKGHHRKSSCNGSSHSPIGAGTPVYDSVLDGLTSPEDCQSSLINIIRCLLFLVGPDSTELSSFLSPTNSLTSEECHRIRLCCEYGADVDDEMMRIILKAAAAENSGLSAETALTLIEYLFLNCRRERRAKICINDYRIAWELYTLVEYKPAVAADNHKSCSESENDSSDQEGSASSKKRKAAHLEENTNGCEKKEATSLVVPQLAFPGMWWRVTSLILVMCGASPNTIGAAMWHHHPTLQALIKMTTSGRYRFPTTDCDEDAKEAMKKGEADLRDQESKITEFLFLPPSAKARKKRKFVEASPTAPSGSRMSARQREKQAKLVALQREQEAAIALAEAQRVKKLLRAAQKSIMIMDPKGPPRKPPKESVNLILSVDDLFGISDTFRLCSEPDYLIDTIGGTSRDSIERSSIWLIPIISSHPETINRLPSSASCFLLLRAYGTDGDKNDQLLDLSAPLLRHVSSCLAGDFGEADALRAADLLLIDVADQSPDRRRCARKVLQEAIGKKEDIVSHFNDDEFSWVFNLLHSKYAESIVEHAIQHLSHSLVHEHGRALRALVLGLHKYTEFAKEKNRGEPCDFDSILVELISVRPHVCSAVMDRFGDFQDLAICTVSRGFVQHSKRKLQESGNAVWLTLYHSLPEPSGQNSQPQPLKILIPAPLLYAGVVVLSNWQGKESEFSHDDFGGSGILDSTDPKKAVRVLMNYLIAPIGPGDINGALPGAAGAVFLSSGHRAVSAEHWVMLAKSRSDFIARHAALCAPDVFLPRLLLCSGIPCASLFSMIERLGQLGDSSSDRNKCFSQLFAPAAVAEWGVVNMNKRRVIARKLLGRVSAYLDHEQNHGDNPMVKSVLASSSFVSWLMEECHRNEKAKKARNKKSGATFSGKAKSPRNPPCSVTSQLAKTVAESAVTSYQFGEELEETSFAPEQPEIADHTMQEGKDVLTVSLVRSCCCDGDFVRLGRILEKGFYMETQQSQECVDIAKTMLVEFSSPSNSSKEFGRIVLKWIPLLTQTYGSNPIWESIFSTSLKSVHGHDNSTFLISRCAEQWDNSHIKLCHDWILDRVEKEKYSDLSLLAMLRFFVITSGQSSVHQLSFDAVSSSFSSVSSQSQATAAVLLSLKCAAITYDSGDGGKTEHTSRNSLPDWLTFLLLLAKCGKRHLALITKMVLHRLPSPNWEGRILPAVLLRLYVYFPSMMDLGNAKLRGVLLEATGSLASEWLEWRCPLDDQLEDMVLALSINPNQRLLQGITERAKRHPLIVMRQLSSIARTLKDDGAVSQLQRYDQRGRLHGGVSIGAAVAKIPSGMVKVTVRHWGYSFTEPVWASVLDILLSIPSEVIFSCGCQMGLLEVFSTVVRLIAIQHEIKSSESTARLRAKLVNLLTAFRTSNAVRCAEWMESREEGIKKWGSVRDLAKRCEFELPEVQQRAKPV